MVDCFAYSDTALVERAVDGTEVAVSVVDTGDGPFALPAVEIVTDGPYDYDARYNPGRTEYFAPARLLRRADGRRSPTSPSPRTGRSGSRHLSRTDLIVDADGTAVVPRGQRGARDDRDVAAPAGRRGRRAVDLGDAVPVARRGGARAADLRTSHAIVRTACRDAGRRSVPQVSP